MTISPEFVKVASDATNTTFAVTSNTKWTVSTTSDWATVATTSGENNGEVKITFSENSTDTERTADIVVTTEDRSITKTFKLTQNGVGAKTYTLQFGTPYNSADEKIGSYTKTWNATRDGFTWTMVNWNNNNNGWKHVRAGNKTAASVATITTNTTIPEAISTVTMTIDAITTTSVNLIKLDVLSADNNIKETITGEAKKGDCVFKITNPQKGCKYKITVDCQQGSSNGLVQVSKVVYANF